MHNLMTSISPTHISPIHLLKRNLQLAWDLAYRDLAGRFKKSSAGILWLVITPISYAAIYWLVFGGIMKLKWVNSATGAEIPYIAPMFAGLATYLFLSDTINASLSTFRQKRAYVRKAAVPLWVLWLSSFLTVSVGAAIKYLVLVFLVAISGLLSWRAIALIPIALTLVFAVTIPISFLLSLLGAFFADLEEGSRIILRVLLYTAPVTYPIHVIPSRFLGLIWANPLTVLVEIIRDAFVLGVPPPILPSFALVTIAIAILALAIWLYTRLKGAIGDVV
jgi:lipopolysaccharide transport system permease protein